MVNLVWVAMAVIGIVYAMINGTMEAINKAVFDGAKDAVTICIGLISVLVFWLGLMKIAEEAGLLKKLVSLFMPIVKRLFPEIPKDHPSMGFILSNMMANFFGLGNAATPLGIKAMEQLKELNGGKDSASRSMVTFLALNTSAITLIPTTVISIRMTYESANPTEIVGVTFIAQVLSMIGAIWIDRYFYRRRSRKGRKK
ncbi:spore maturation protein SpmA [Bacillus tropicus]|jgi:spore maturation protein A|uniref:Spore maturation protein n=9 Tax=Bacillus TaxID=1386 RepID=A0A2B8INY0_BACAN|nr:MULTISPECIES: spore maturation protein SpmA [Bacillus]AJH74464.1 spore maturation protein A [Bacillus cereus ATCC 4342]AJI06674.1 spore maturation protein A [Bacillus cereus G9241]AZJ19671.1 spore maturation protein [Bacillus wiedmannii bv. thuringiensis]EOP08626.1 spore maturation protein A [Bacillus cereus BAG2O-3]EOQ13391.1 spore maturation protein A [Bacillus cereus B5-2]EOQ33095.1 spore maturation protein A [Bacillus cereus BAG3O-1]OTX86571.1 spore maturation protein [Bacillus thurin